MVQEGAPSLTSHPQPGQSGVASDQELLFPGLLRVLQG